MRHFGESLGQQINSLLGIVAALLTIGLFVKPVFRPPPEPTSQLTTRPVLHREQTSLDLPECVDPYRAVAVAFSISNRRGNVAFTDCWWTIPLGIPFAARVEPGAHEPVDCALSQDDLADWQEQQAEDYMQTTDGRTEGPVHLEGALRPAPKDGRARQQVESSEIAFFCPRIPSGSELDFTLWYSEDIDPRPDWGSVRFVTEEHGAHYEWYTSDVSETEVVATGTRTILWLALASMLCVLTTGWGLLSGSRLPSAQ